MRELVTNFTWLLTGEPQAMLVEDGRVVWRHRVSPGEALPAADRTVDLAGKSLLPGFVDAHCHILPAGLDLKAVSLSACATHDDVLDALRDRLPELGPGVWLDAVQYDHNRLPGALHLSRAQLDSVSPDVPILISHVSGHAAVANSAALAAAKVNSDTPDPRGGTCVRDEAGELTGVLLETACDKVAAAAPKPSLDAMVEAIMAAGDLMADQGITAAADMMTGFFSIERELEAYRIAAERGCRIRTRLYLGWSQVFGPRAISSERLRELTDAMDPARCRVAGVKVFADGALSSRTAAIHGAFSGDLEPQHKDGWSGTLIYPPDRLHSMLARAHEGGYTVAVHALGDYAVDRVLDGFDKLEGPGRHRIEHAMILSDAQIERMARANVTCVMQPEFLLRLAPAYQRNLGSERAGKLNRYRSVLDAGIRLAFSSDRPVVGGNPLDGVRSAHARPTGFDDSENLTRGESLLAYTAGSADALGDSGCLGRLLPGEWADWQVMDGEER